MFVLGLEFVLNYIVYVFNIILLFNLFNLIKKNSDRLFRKFSALVDGDYVAQYQQPGSLKDIWAAIQPARDIIQIKFVHVDIYFVAK